LTNNAPAVILINVGYYDALNGTPDVDFRNRLNEIIQIATTNGTIPVLLTVPTNVGLVPERSMPSTTNHQRRRPSACTRAECGSRTND
jgi:hypothetical protein